MWSPRRSRSSCPDVADWRSGGESEASGRGLATGRADQTETLPGRKPSRDADGAKPPCKRRASGLRQQAMETVDYSTPLPGQLVGAVG